MKDHCWFLQALNVGGERESLNLYGKSTGRSRKKWWLYTYNNFTNLLLLLLKPFRGRSGRNKRRRTATLWELWPTSVPQNCQRLGNECVTLVETCTHILGIVLIRLCSLWVGNLARDGGIVAEESDNTAITSPLKTAYMFISLYCHMSA